MQRNGEDDRRENDNEALHDARSTFTTALSSSPA
jgi:hypothetical protein